MGIKHRFSLLQQGKQKRQKLRAEPTKVLSKAKNMKMLSLLAICYGILFMLSIVAGNYVLATITGLLGAALLLAVAIALETVSENVAKEQNEIRTEIKKIYETLKKLSPTTNQTITENSDTPKDERIGKMKEALEATYTSKMMVYPLEVLELDIKAKVTSGKTREQAIEELYKEKVEKRNKTP